MFALKGNYSDGFGSPKPTAKWDGSSGAAAAPPPAQTKQKEEPTPELQEPATPEPAESKEEEVEGTSVEAGEASGEGGETVEGV